MPLALSQVPFSRPVVADEAGEAVQRVLRSGWLTTGPECVAFEQEFAAHVGVEHAVTVASCTAALELSLRALHLPLGSLVLTPTMTFCGAVEAIVHAGLVPVLADVDPWSGLATPETCRAAAKEVGGVRAMVALHYAGLPADTAALADAAGVPLSHVVEDAAHALGTVDGDRPVGGQARAACFSFYATKNLPIGEGGMVTTDDADLAAWVRSARLHGMSHDAWRRYLPGGSWRYSVEEQGLKANLSDVQATVGRVQLRHVDEWQRRREQLAERYDVLLGQVPGIALPQRPARGRHGWHLYVIRVEPGFPLGRDDLSQRLGELGIGTSVHFIPVHHLPRYRSVAARGRAGFPGADQAFIQILSLPLHQGLRDDEIDTVADALAEAGQLHVQEVRQ